MVRDLFCIGEMLVDFIPGPEPGSYMRSAGGAPANVAVAAARQGLSAAMCCSVGDDDFGRFLLRVLRENGVEVIQNTPRGEAVTTMAIVSLDEAGERNFTFVRKPGADMLLCEADVREEQIADSVIVHGGSFSLSAAPCAQATEKALRLAAAHGRLVSFDLNYRDMIWGGDFASCAAAVHRVLPYVDALKLSEEEAALLCADLTVPELMARYGVRVVVETLGAGGARCFFNGEILRVPGRRAVCADATGAGDAFWGGFLSALRINGAETGADLTAPLLRRALEYGNKCGWFCVQRKGAIQALPTRADIEALA